MKQSVNASASPQKSIRENSVVTTEGSGSRKKKRKKKGKKEKNKQKRGNMYRHAQSCHKGHTVYIGIQDQSVILFSKSRETVYPEKLYVDRFGQELKDKVNIFEEDWNFFELNGFVLKRLREAVENHTLPQLIYSIMKGHYKLGEKF